MNPTIRLKSHLAQFALDPTASGYSPAQAPPIVTRALEALRGIPGVKAVAGTTDPELQGNMEVNGYMVQGYKPAEGEHMDFESPWITPGYFATLRQPLTAGREFTVADGNGAEKVAVVNLNFAKKFYGSPQNALGHMIGEGDPRTAKPDTRIVGVVGDTKHYDLRTELGPAVYRPYLQMEHPTGIEVYVRTRQQPEAIEGAIRAAMQKLDPTLVVDGLQTMDQQVNVSASDERALAILATGFSLLAMLLAGVGLYGVLAYSTEQRTREIGVRLALGAQRWSVVLAVVREMAVIAAISIAAALPSVAALARLFRSQLYGVSTFDPLSLVVALALTAGVLILAAALPARRAAYVEPMQALRME